MEEIRLLAAPFEKKSGYKTTAELKQYEEEQGVELQHPLKSVSELFRKYDPRVNLCKTVFAPESLSAPLSTTG